MLSPTQLPYANSEDYLIRSVGISPTGLSHFPETNSEIGNREYLFISAPVNKWELFVGT
jgi:hypothetical protein